MALQAPYTTDTKAVGNYFIICHARYICAPGTPVPHWQLWVNMYADEAARNANTNPISQMEVNIIGEDPRPMLYGYLKADPMFDGAVVSDVLDPKEDRPLEIAKALKKAEITNEKIKANRSFFLFRGKRIQADEASMLEIQTTMNGVLARGSLREDWPGGWLAMDNTTVPIPDLQTWFEFYNAIEATGQRNFNHSRALKALVDQVTTIQELDNIVWGMDPAQYPNKVPLPDMMGT